MPESDEQGGGSKRVRSAVQGFLAGATRVGAATGSAMTAVRGAVADAASTNITVVAFRFPTGPRKED